MITILRVWCWDPDHDSHPCDLPKWPGKAWAHFLINQEVHAHVRAFDDIN